MDKVSKHLDEAFRLISGLSVSGDAVDVIFMVKEELRAAYKLLNEEDKPDENN